MEKDRYIEIHARVLIHGTEAQGMQTLQRCYRELELVLGRKVERI